MPNDFGRVMYFPDGNNNGNVPAWVLPFMNNNGNGGLFGGNNGWGGGILGFLLGLMFGNGGFGNFFGGGWNGNNGGAGFLSNQINNDNGRELIMQAVTSQGEQARQAISTLSTMLGQDFNLVNSNIQAIQAALSTMAVQLGITPLQIINSIQAGNADLRQQLCQCCCDNKFAIAEQTSQLQQGMNTGFNGVQMGLNQGFNGVERGIGGIQTQMAVNQGQEELGRCKQTYEVVQAGNNNTNSILAEIRAMQTQNLQDKLEKARDENSVLRGTINVERQTQQFGAMLQATVAPILARQQQLDDKVDSIACKIPNTVPVTWPNIQAVNVSPQIPGGFYGNSGYQNGYPGNYVF